jgi:protein FAM50
MDKDARKKDGFWKAEATGVTDRVRRLNAKRDKERQEFEDSKVTMAKDSEVAVVDIAQRFATTDVTADQIFTDATTGLVSKEEYAERRELLQRIVEEQEAKRKREEERQAEERKAKKVKPSAATLSFGEEEEEEQVAGPGLGKRTFGKDPDVDTSFLPDKGREEEEAQLRRRLQQDWLAEQERLKKEPLEVTYSYWDGRGTRKKVTVLKGWTIEQFLREVQKQFKELSRLSTSNLMYIKEDLIIPHHYTFYDLIIMQARGKSGPLFAFDVHDDVRLVNDATVEKHESHSGKVVDRKWYERNQHVFPASRWEPFDPNKDYGSYTIRGKPKRDN